MHLIAFLCKDNALTAISGNIQTQSLGHCQTWQGVVLPPGLSQMPAESSLDLWPGLSHDSLNFPPGHLQLLSYLFTMSSLACSAVLPTLECGFLLCMAVLLLTCHLAVPKELLSECPELNSPLLQTCWASGTSCPGGDTRHCARNLPVNLASLGSMLFSRHF